MRLLYLDTSPRAERSISRRLTQSFISSWKNNHTDDIVVYRDLGHVTVPGVEESWIAAAFSPPETYTPALTEAIQLSNDLVKEFLSCERYVIGVPMYNFGIPSGFKAYIDQIVRVNQTFTVNSQGGYDGLVFNRKMLVITARGGSYPAGTPYAQFDFQEPYIRAIFGMMGVTDITFIHADNLSMGDEARQQSLTKAQAAIEQTVKTW
ncbi:acyl carrier protein phosphodiesterase [Rivularia sp. IAM M-261]|nr:acyl carrier protein phosphodiesterase [Rivularia sp. IAM M-261]